MITLKNSKEPDSLICQFMRLVNNFLNKKTPYKALVYHESPTDTKKVMRLSVFITEKDYKHSEENYAWAHELNDYLEGHFPDLADSHSSVVQLCPHCSQRPVQGF